MSTNNRSAGYECTRVPRAGKGPRQLAEERDLFRRVLEWRDGRDSGLSSMAIAHETCGLEHSADHPHDPDDLDRCLILLEQIPETKAGLAQMIQYGPVWPALLDRWDQLVATFLDEVGLGWCKAEHAPLTYAMMRDIIDTARAALAERKD